MEDSTSVVLKFIETINAGDSETLASLQTDDFTFIDMGGHEFVGRDGWGNYFTVYPSYRIHVEHILLSGDSVAVVGKTTGSHIDPSVEVLETVLWLAEVQDGLVSKWRIYSDLANAKKKLGLE